MHCDLDGCGKLIHPDYCARLGEGEEQRRFCCEAHKAAYQRQQLQLLKQMHNGG